MSALRPKTLRMWERIAGIFATIALIIFMGAAWRYNYELSTMPTRDLSSCSGLSPEFVVTSVKGTPECVEAGAAHRFKQADLIGQIALGVYFIFFLPLFVSQFRSLRRRRRNVDA